MRIRSLIVLLVLAVLPGASLAAGDDAPQTFLVRDAMSGQILVHARAAAFDPLTKQRLASATADAAGRIRFVLPDGAEKIELSAAGYQAMKVSKLPSELTGPLATAWLLPDERPEELQPEVIEARRLPAAAMIHGHVYDLEAGRPLAGARVYLEAAGKATTTDEHGYFLLYAKGIRILTREDVPETDDLIVEAPGFVRQRLAHVALIEQDMHFIVDLEPGNGEAVRDMTHKQLRAEAPADDAPPAWEKVEAGPASPALNLKTTTGGQQVMNPEDTIWAYGYGYYPLEVYVARGLCDEWYSSWNAQSHDAGAIAYRSYGSWHQVVNGYVCTTTSCQAFSNTYVKVCDDAAQRTSGLLLQKDGSIAYSEYSSELNCVYCSGCNNGDLSCGHGYAGSPNTSWPCLSDNHSFSQSGSPGTCCFGHGRGMCQWGTSAWANSGYKWNWMIDHYYNNFGSGTGNRRMYLTTPLESVAGSASPSSVSAGSTFTVNTTIRSYADYDHTRLMLGAKLTGPSTLTDNSHNTKVSVLARSGTSVQSRDTAVSRLFTVPSTAPSGTYNLVVELWYDTDNDSQLDSTDKLLTQATYSNAVTVGGGGGGGWTATIDDSQVSSGAVYLGGPSQYWWEVSGYGQNGQMRYTWNAQSSGTNWIYWYFNVPTNGYYKVEVFIPRNHATTTSARYYVHNGSSWVGPYYVNQNTKYDEWVTLTSSVYLAAGTRIVYVGDVTGETTGTTKIGVDAARLTRN